MSISISTYQLNIECFFYEKLCEIDYFLEMLVNEYEVYRSTPAPRDIKHLDKSNFLFSAILNALFSQWEILKLLIQLENYANGRNVKSGINKEDELEKNSTLFNEFFNTEINDSFGWFIFFKNARNASTHDGTIILNGGSDCEFRFSNNIYRYKLDNKSKKFILAKADCPSGCAITAIITMCLVLTALFERKLKEINLADLSLNQQIKENIEVSKLMPFELKQIVLTLINDSLFEVNNKKLGMNIEKFSIKYKEVIDSKFSIITHNENL